MPDLEAIINSSIATATAPADPIDAADEGVTADSVDTPDPTNDIVDPVAPVAPVVADPVTPVDPAVPVVKKDEPVDEFAKEHGVQAKGKDGRENRLPYSRVVKISENAVKKATAALTEAHTKEIVPLQGKVTEYEGRLTRIGQTEDIMFNEPGRFVELLRKIPGYDAVFAKMGGPASPAAPTGRPAPDAKDAAGNPAYSPEGLDALLAWNAAEAVKTATAGMEEKFGKRIEPFEKRAQAIKDAAELEARLIPAIQAEMAEAESWPLFKENAEEILKVLNADPSPTFTLRHAWAKVVVPKLTTDRTKMREELLAEINAAPSSTALPVTPVTKPGSTVDPNKPVDLTDIIKGAIAGSRKK